MSKLGLAPGAPDHSVDSTANYIPELFAAETQIKYYNGSVIPQISNTNFTGEITDMGDRVTIRTKPDITIRDYTKGMKLERENPTSPSIELSIDKGKYWNVGLDDVDKHQDDLEWMPKFAEDASEQMKKTVETDIFASIYSQVDSSNSGLTAGAETSAISLGVTGTPIALTKANILEVIVDLGTVLDEQNVPDPGRWLVLPPLIAGLIKKSDLKDVSLTGDDTSPMRTGLLGMINNFVIYKSNLLTSVTDGANTPFHIPFGHKDALTFASQIVKTEMYRPEDGFNDAMKGLKVYGYKVVTPKAMGDLYAYI